MGVLIDGIARYLATTVDGLAYGPEVAGGNVFLDDLPSTPDTAVGIYPIAGLEASALLGYEAPRLQIIVRGDDDPVTALTVWNAVYSALHALRNHTLPDGTYLAWCIATTSGPVRLIPDENNRHKYAMNLRCEITSVTAHR